MLLEIRDIHQNSFKIKVELSDTIGRVKEKVNTEIEALDVDDQTLVYSGNILADDRTVEECEFKKSDYVNLIYRHSINKDEVCKMIEKARNKLKLEEGKNCGDCSEELSDAAVDLSFDDLSLSRSALMKSSGVTKLCDVICANPDALPKILSKLSRQGPIVFEKIVENQHAFMDLLDPDERGSVDNGMEKLETKDHKAIERLMKKGYGKEMASQVYKACHCNESGAEELLNYLHSDGN